MHAGLRLTWTRSLLDVGLGVSIQTPLAAKPAEAAAEWCCLGTVRQCENNLLWSGPSYQTALNKILQTGGATHSALVTCLFGPLKKE